MKNELNFLIYNTPNEDVSVNAVVKDETIWLTQKAMAELFEVGVPTISKHLTNIFAEEELEEKVVISILETTTEHGAIKGKTQTKATKFYNLDAINQHLKTIYNDNELKQSSTIKKYLTVQMEGNRQVSRNIDHYNLQSVLAKIHAETEFEKYRIVQDRLFQSDFDKILLKEGEENE